MSMRATSEADIALIHRTALWLVSVQSVLGVFLLMKTLLPLVHGVLAALLLAVLLLCHYRWERRGFRVLTRVLTGLPLVLAALFAVSLVMLLSAGSALTMLLEFMCILGGVALSYLAPGILYVSLKEGGYDRGVACFTSTWLAALALIATFYTPVRYNIVWSWDSVIVRFAWVVCAVLGTLLTWMCALARTPEQKAAKAAKRSAKATQKA